MKKFNYPLEVLTQLVCQKLQFSLAKVEITGVELKNYYGISAD